LDFQFLAQKGNANPAFRENSDVNILAGDIFDPGFMSCSRKNLWATCDGSLALFLVFELTGEKSSNV